MKFITLFIVIASFISVGGNAIAQNQQVTLPSAGFTPESALYFLDKFGEALRQFFTFNPEGKARLQITFAAERIAEIKMILETKGVEAKGLEVAQSRLQAHLANAATIVVDQKAEGKDVSGLAKELDDEFEGHKTVLEQTFKDQERALEAQEKDLKAKIRQARLAGDTAQVESLVKQLGEVKAQKEFLELKEEEAEEALEREEERIEEEMEAKEKAEKAIREAEKEKQEVLDEAAEENISVPAETFGKFDGLLAQAKSALEAGNFAEAKRLAKQAEKSLDSVEEAIEELEEAKEKEEELKEEQEEKEREAKEEQEEKLKSEIILKEGERDGPFLLEKIYPDRVTGLNFMEFPVARDTGRPLTLRIGESATNGCTITLTLTKIEGNIAKFKKITDFDRPCPICLAGNTLIDTPLGLVPVKDLQVGMPVWTMNKTGQRVSGVIIKTSKVLVPQTHQMVQLVLDDGRWLFVSPGHPTIDGRTVGGLSPGDLYDGVSVASTERVPYDENTTYDILPSGDTGFYWASGILIGSTLR